MMKYRTDQETAAGKAYHYHSVPVINLWTACVPHTTIQHGNSTRETFLTTDDLLDETSTKYRIDLQIKAKAKLLIATAPTRKLIYSLHAMSYTTNRHGSSTGRITDDGRTTCWTKWRRNTAPTENDTGKAYRSIQDESNYTVWKYNTTWDYFV